MQKFSNQHFRFGISATDTAHIIAAGFLIMHIGHAVKLNIIKKDRCLHLLKQVIFLCTVICRALTYFSQNYSIINTNHWGLFGGLKALTQQSRVNVTH